MATPEADVGVPPLQEGMRPDQPRRGLGRVVKVSRLDKIVGLVLAVAIGVPVLLVIMWIVLQFVLGFLSSLFGF